MLALFLEYNSGNPYQLHTYRSVPCMNLCPHCDGTMKKMIKCVSKNGLSRFLSTLINVDTTELTPVKVAKRLFEYPNVGKVVYSRTNSIKAESISITQLTILQLFASDILILDIKEASRPIVKCKLNIDVNTGTPTYLINDYWTYIDYE